MTAKLEDRQSIITGSDRNNSNTTVNKGVDETAVKLSHDSVEKCVHEDESPAILFKMQEDKLSSRMTYASMLEGEHILHLSVGFVRRFLQYGLSHECALIVYTSLMMCLS
jgi:hypothetical protein